MRRYHVAERQALRVAQLADHLVRDFLQEQATDEVLRLLSWAAALHEIGISVAHTAYHKHTAYILANADMPGFSKKEQTRLSLLALAHRGGLEKVRGKLDSPEVLAQAMALRLAALMYRNRSDTDPPAMQGRFSGTKFHLQLPSGWLAKNPLTDTALQEETEQWKELGVSVQVLELEG
jgi:exopolyphosphatase / guanosine-5'-triphosphate,3'-diphosphate pyrophosphatase